MSLNIQVVANKCEFSNEFSEGITLPANTQIALTKLGMNIPVFIQNVVRVPRIGNPDGTDPTGQRNEVALVVIIDGITKQITWLDIFNAHIQYPGVAILEPNLTINGYYSGGYTYFTNNKFYLQTEPQSALRDGNLPPFTWVLAKAIENAYQFYDITDISEWKGNDCSFGAFATDDLNLTLKGRNNHVYNNCSIIICNQKSIRLNARYNPYKIMSQVPTSPGGLAGANLLNFNNQPGGDDITGNGTGSALYVANNYSVDLNGGFIRCQPTFVNGYMKWGFSLAGRGNGADNIDVSAQTATSPVIDIGIHWIDNSRFRIIDGIKSITTYDGNTVSTNYIEQYSTSVPINKYNNGQDYFFIQVQRGNITSNSTSEFIFNLYQGNGAITNAFTFPIYTWKRTLQGANINPTEIAQSSAHANIFMNLAIIQAGADSIQMRNQTSLYQSGCKGVFSVIPFTTQDEPDVRDFWSAYGLTTLTSNPTLTGNILLDLIDSNMKIVGDEDGTYLNKTLAWAPDFKDEDNTSTNLTYYWVGVNNLSKFFKYETITNSEGEFPPGQEQWNINASQSLFELPSFLNVYVNNLDVKNYQGSFFGLTDTQTQSGQTRLVGTVPLLIDDDSVAQDVVINYETFNSYYRPINNSNPFKINQLITEISFKSNITDQKYIIELVNGLVRVEYNIRSGSVPKEDKYTTLKPLI
jgi:hypothetical protein